MKVFGLIGFPLGHSWSPGWFNEKFISSGISGCEYRLFPLPSIDTFPELLNHTDGLSGLNVTIPYKEKIIPYLSSIDPEAGTIGAVNVITIRHIDGQKVTRGYNTDVIGFEMTLEDLPGFTDALILGTGGAAKSVARALTRKNIRFSMVSRNPDQSGVISYTEVNPEIMARHLLIINTTPVGMYPRTEELPPLPYACLTRDHCLYDLIYNPGETLFLKKGIEAGAMTVNGFRMLHNQAELSWELFMKP